ASQLVVQLAFAIIVCFAASHVSLFTLMTTVLSAPLGEAEMMTVFAPASRCLFAFAASVNSPVDSMTYSTPSCFQGRAVGPSLTARHLILWPLTTSMSSSATDAADFSLWTLPWKRPWVESYFSK